jgi:hypothetical protein
MALLALLLDGLTQVHAAASIAEENNAIDFYDTTVSMINIGMLRRFQGSPPGLAMVATTPLRTLPKHSNR